METKNWVLGIWVWVPQRLVCCHKQILNISIVSYSPKTVPGEPVKQKPPKLFEKDFRIICLQRHARGITFSIPTILSLSLTHFSFNTNYVQHTILERRRKRKKKEISLFFKIFFVLFSK